MRPQNEKRHVLFQCVASSNTEMFNFQWANEHSCDRTAHSLVVASGRVHQVLRKLQKWESQVCPLPASTWRHARRKLALPSPPRGVFRNSCFHGLRDALKSLNIFLRRPCRQFLPGACEPHMKNLEILIPPGTQRLPLSPDDPHRRRRWYR